jgi:predicted SAM-dependent methyltransferase
MKALIQKFFNKFGYQIERITKKADNKDFDLYKKLFPPDSIDGKKFYNFGAGLFRHPYWTNVDYKTDYYSEVESPNYINFNFFSLQTLPISSEFGEVCYTSHTIEHLNDETVQFLFNEAYRILKPGGFFRVTTPDIELYYEAYKIKDKSVFYWIDQYSLPKYYKRVGTKPFNQASIQEIFLYEFASQTSNLIDIEENNQLQKISDTEFDILLQNKELEDALNYCTSKCSVDIQSKYPGHHINWWNEKKLRAMLKKSGFNTIYRSGYGQSLCPVMRNIQLFDSTHPKISIYMEAQKKD